MKNILLIAFALGLFVQPAQAAGTLPGAPFAAAAKLNRDVKISKEEFFKRARLIEETPLGDKSLAFQIRLGKDWVKLESQGSKEQKDLSKQILGEIAHYLGPPTLDLRSSFTLRANELPYDVNASDWFYHHMKINNYTLQGLDVSSEKRLQAQYIMVDRGSQSIVRATVHISGPKVFLAEYKVPVELWPQERDMAKWSMGSFFLKNPDLSPVETRESYSFVDIAQFEFPKSWLLSAPPISSIERMNASVINFKGGVPQKSNIRDFNSDVLLMDGRIDVSIVTKTEGVTLPGEVTALKKQMEEKGLVLGDYIETAKDWPHHDSIKFARIDAYKLNNSHNKLVDYEEWIGVFETPGRFYLVRLLTIGRQDDFMIWARNIQAYKTVIATLSPVD